MQYEDKNPESMYTDKLTLGKRDVNTILKAAETQPIPLTAYLPAFLLLY